ncbi:MAG: endolytic transglycosylase MltG [Anaerolineae bacterium]|nr:endolytic transglycosylase MltG [Anaerolineae bacterium]
MRKDRPIDRRTRRLRDEEKRWRRERPRSPLWRRIFSAGNILRFVITLAVLGAVGLLAVVGLDHLRGQLEAGRVVTLPEGQAPSAGLPAWEGFSLESLENTLLGMYLRLNQQRIETPVGIHAQPVPFFVEPGETAATIAERLQELGLISDAQLFRLYMRYTGVDAHLEAGQFELSPAMNMIEIAERLQRARADEIVVTIPEGLRAEEVAELLTAQGALDGERFLELVRAANPAAAGLGSADFLDDLPAGATLEGFLFPDTYRLPVPAEPEDLLRRMLANFDRQVTPELRQAARAAGRSLYEVVTLASIVEREALLAEEMPVIADVYLNRLEQGMFLRADPTVQYAMGYQPASGQWWKTPVQLEEYEAVDSPYNTYLYPGLPPGPICSPGLKAIEAVVYPADTNFLYFVATGDGSHAFAETFEEHEANVARYQR